MLFRQFLRSEKTRLAVAAVLAIVLLALALSVFGTARMEAQDQSQTSSAGPQKQEPPPEAGGPQTDVGPYAVPKKKEAPPEPPPERPKKIEGMPDYSLRVNVPLVNVDALVTTKDGQFVPGLKKENFRVYEDGVAQSITNFSQAEAPITAVLLVEFASTNYFFLKDALDASYTFANTLKKNDWIAVVSYDMKPRILTDFTQDKNAVRGALGQLSIPGFAETNLFDALFDTLDRLDRIDGHKYIILVSTGVDTFSKLNLDQIFKKIKTTHDITIFPVSVGGWLRAQIDNPSRGLAIPTSHMDYLQADNEMNTFARMTGGRAYFPRFRGELPSIFNDIGADIRNQYSLAYHPTNSKLDGSFRKLKVEIVSADGSPLKVRDQHGKEVKYQVIAREGYTAKHVVD